MMRLITACVSVAAASMLALPAQAAQYPPTKPVSCSAKVKKRALNVTIGPKGTYSFVVQRKKGTYRVQCTGSPNYLDARSSSRKVK